MFTLVSVLLPALYFCSCSKSYEAEVEYYEKLIQTNINESFYYETPTDARAYKPTSPTTYEFGSFDYIVIGAGSAGAVVASRLSENANWTVLLLEAGGEETDFSDIPAMYLYLQGSPMNWGYVSTPQNGACLGMVNRSCSFPRGRVLGGTSVLNNIIYCRGNRLDYDSWAAQGNPGWSYKDVLPFFKKSEDSMIKGDPGYHGKGGPLHVEYHKYNNEQLRAFLNANKESDVSTPIDYNGRRQLGSGYSQFNTVNGRRDSSAKAFLRPAKDRKNLTVLTWSYVVKLIINNKTKETEGVLFTYKGRQYITRCRREVILSAGAINSPHLLMLSGIGPAQHLQQHGISVIQDLAVGENLQDHATFYGANFVTNYTEPASTLREYIKDYLNGTGPFTIAGNLEGIGFYQVKPGAHIPGYPDIEFLMWVSNNTNNYIQRSFRYTDETYNSVWGKMDGQRSITIDIVLLHPKSKGTVRLKTADPYDYPLIDPAFFTDPKDIDIATMYAGFQLAIKLTKTKAFQKLNAKLLYAPLPQCIKDFKYDTEQYWYCVIRYLTSDVYHPMCTCKMGPDPKKGAVVDHTLKVHGIKRLRVADASIIPFAISGHTSAPSMMIGEKTASLIIDEANAIRDSTK